MEQSSTANIKKNMIFNTGGALIYYFCQWLLSVVIVRISGYEVAGVFGLATTVTASPAIIALFNVRNYQVSDINGEYSKKTYIQSRHYTNALAYVVCLVMLLAGGYSMEKFLVTSVFMVYKLAEGYADVYYGIEQRHGRMDYAGISMTLRGILTIAPFILAQMLWGNLLLSLAIISVCSFGVVFVYDRWAVRQWKSEEEHAAGNGNKAIFALLWTCVPLAVMAFLNNMSVNVPKLVLEHYYGSEVMGYFSSISSPALVVQLAATTIFAPLVTPMTEAYQAKDKKKLYHMLGIFAGLMFAMAVLAIGGAALLGDWALCLVFGKDIHPYTYLFTYCIASTLCMAVTSCLMAICTLIREIKSQYIAGILGIATSALCAFLIIPNGEMLGTITAQAISMLVQIVVMLVIILRNFKRNL